MPGVVGSVGVAAAAAAVTKAPESRMTATKAERILKDFSIGEKEVKQYKFDLSQTSLS